MKKTFVILIVTLLLSHNMFSQEDQVAKLENENFNELKLNALFLILGALEVTYERTLNEESGIGLTVFLPLDNDVSDEIKYYISPYYRFYFGNKYASGFFLEGFGMINSTNRDFNFFESEDDFRTDFALGIGLGGKWITNSGFIGEINFGVGRNLFNNNNTDYEIIAKGGISLGYRF